MMHQIKIIFCFSLLYYLYCAQLKVFQLEVFMDRLKLWKGL